MDYRRSDSILREVLEDRKTLEGFLDAIFGFMSRNTDFYHIQSQENDKLGFPRGVKEQIITSCMQKYEFEQPKVIKDLPYELPSFFAEEVEIVTGESHEQNNKIQQSDQKDFELLNSSKTNASVSITKFSGSEYKNGSAFENYCWSQTPKDVELSVLLPNEVKSSKDVKLYFKSDYMTIEKLYPCKEILISSGTFDKYRHNDVIWSISDRKLIISFDKIKECWWDKLFLTETSINIKKVETERSITDYSSDIQNGIEKIYTQEKIANHEEKLFPLNESEQIARLREAWNYESSPFKGQPFDPSLIKFN